MSWLESVRRPLTKDQARGIRLQLLLIPMYLWLAFVWSAYASDISPPGRLDRSGHIKGHDFVHFYVLGEIARDHAGAELFSLDAQAKRTDRIVPEYEDRFLPIYGPQVSLFFRPFASLPYQAAAAVWLLLTGAIYAVCLWALWRRFPALRARAWTAVLLAAAYPPFYFLVASGHITALALLCFTGAFLALAANRPWLAGFALGSLFFKPTLGLVVPVVFLLRQDWRVVAGAAAAVALQLGLAAAAYGGGILQEYWRVVTHLGSAAGLLEPQPYQMHSLRSFFSILLPWPGVAFACYLGSSAAVLAVAVAAWKRSAPIELRFAIFVLASVLVDPHVNAYDLVVLAPVLLLVTGWALERRLISRLFWTLVYLSYVVSAFVPLAATTRVQVSIPIYTALLIVLVRLARPSGALTWIEARR